MENLPKTKKILFNKQEDRTKPVRWFWVETVTSDFYDKIEKHLGRCAIQIVPKTDTDLKKISSYLAKLTNHALKVKQSKICYKRESPFKSMNKEIDRHHRLGEAYKTNISK